MALQFGEFIIPYRSAQEMKVAATLQIFAK
jgi:hypothetical protein